jgi:DNA-binding NarL/FixJ family response regulator
LIANDRSFDRGATLEEDRFLSAKVDRQVSARRATNLACGSCVDEGTGMARNSNERWTPEEDKRLLKLRADGKSSILIAAALRRSLGSVQGRIYLIRRRAAGDANVTPSDRTRTTWSLADEQRLSEMNAAGASVSEIATAMDRTEAAIENRIHLLKH